jgi:hypothetical protein
MFLETLSKIIDCKYWGLFLSNQFPLVNVTVLMPESLVLTAIDL